VQRFENWLAARSGKAPAAQTSSPAAH